MPATLTSSTCAPWTPVGPVAAAPRPPLNPAALDTALARYLSITSLHTAYGFGLLPLLADYARARQWQRQQPMPDHQLAALALGQQLNQRLTQAQLEIAAVAAELDCEEEHADQLAGYLAARAAEAETRLTAASIVAGAVGAAATGALYLNSKTSNASNLVGIGTGLMGALLGLKIFRNAKHPARVLVAHPRNPLQAVWDGSNAAGIFPASVWHYLAYPRPAAPAGSSVREQLVASWTGFGQLGPAHSPERARLTRLFFGAGGAYSAAELSTRADMNDELESQVNLLQRHLARLSQELAALP